VKFKKWVRRSSSDSFLSFSDPDGNIWLVEEVKL
jgi:hypothetical protein